MKRLIISNNNMNCKFGFKANLSKMNLQFEILYWQIIAQKNLFFTFVRIR